MARLASEAKAGYFPTPPEEMELVLRAIRLDEAGEAPFYIYDPCCGEGEALAMIATHMRSSGARVITYGTEIEEGRAEIARKVLDHVLHEGYQNVRTEPKYSLLWLNPPYQSGFSERAELTFLRALTGSKQCVLQRDGILLFCVPQYVLKDCAGVLSGRFKNVQVYRFTDENYGVFQQVVLVGQYGRATISEQKRLYKSLIAIGEGDKHMLPTLDEMNPFTVHACMLEEPPLFRGGRLNTAELVKDLEGTLLAEEIEKRLIPKNNASTFKRPMLPLKVAHIGIAIASGAVGGNMGSHLISGVTKQRVETEKIRDDEGNVMGLKKTTYFSTVIRAFTSEGVFDLGL